MNPVLLRLLASLKIPVYIAVGCGGTIGVQYYMTSSSSSWDEKAATEKEGSGKGMKFEINQLSKQLEEKEQSLKTWEEMLAKQAADLKEQQQAVSSAPARTTVATTVAEPKPDQPIIDDVPFGEEDTKRGKLKASNIAQRGIAKKEAEAPTSDGPKRPAVFDGGGTPAVAFSPMADVVAIKEEGDIPERLQAELRARDRSLEVLREQREESRKEKEADFAKYKEELRRLDSEKNALEAELEEKDRQLTELNTSNEDLKRELEETGQKLAKAEEEAKEKVLQLEQLGFLVQMADEMQKERMGKWNKLKTVKAAKLQVKGDERLSLAGTVIPKDGNFAVCRLEPKKASHGWYFGFPMVKWMFDACLDNRRKVLTADMVRNKKVNLSDVNECYSLAPTALYVCATSDPEGGRVVKKGKDRYSVRPQPRVWWCCLFCLCRKRTKEIRKLKYEEVVVKVMSEGNGQDPKGKDRDSVRPQPRGGGGCLLCPCKKRTNEIPKLNNIVLEEIPEVSDVLSPEEQTQFEKRLSEINSGSFVPLDDNDGFFLLRFMRRFNAWWWGDK